MKMRRNTTPLLEDNDAIPGLLSKMPDFENIFERLSPAQVEAILDEQLATDGNAENRSNEGTRYKTKNSVDKAFDDLMTGK
jgi:hypothetical protein